MGHNDSSYVTRTFTVHPAITLDSSVQQQNESEQHWAVKAAICDRLRSDPDYIGTIETEKKTSDLIGDIRCQLSESPSHMPQRFVIEVETAASNKDRLRATIGHLRFGYSVCWIFTVDAHEERRETENILEEFTTSEPSLGVASLADGELSLGTPVRWDEFSPPTPWLGRHELYIPTYNRYVNCFNHGDFKIEGNRVTIYRKPGRGQMYVSWHLENGQQTLPKRAGWDIDEFLKDVQQGKIERVSPVRGPP
ncbi:MULTISPECIES: hypothetical protein [Haloarcula]|uniref:hypothetical protein n=1 Tax=Haloarcula TaxID=2237 RepID=UPI0023EB555E|nr:hypothetical protein [Halomicroarcula sp. XH51]